MEDKQKEIQNLWRKMVAEMNHALSDKCIRELQARGVLEIRFQKFCESLQGTIRAIKEFTEPESLLRTTSPGPLLPSVPSQSQLQAIAPDPFDVKNLPQIAPCRAFTIQQINETKSLPKTLPAESAYRSVPSNQSANGIPCAQRNSSMSAASDMRSDFSVNSRNSVSSHSDSYHTSLNTRSNISNTAMEFENPFRYGNIRMHEMGAYAEQNSGSVVELSDDGDEYHTCRPKSPAGSAISVHTLTPAALSPANDEQTDNNEVENVDVHPRVNNGGGVYEGADFNPALPQPHKSMIQPRQEGYTVEYDDQWERRRLRPQTSGDIHCRSRSQSFVASASGSSREQQSFSRRRYRAAVYRGDENTSEREHIAGHLLHNGYAGPQGGSERGFAVSRFSNVPNETECTSTSKAKKITYPVENVFKPFETFEERRQQRIVLPSPDLTYDSSEDEEDLEQQQQFDNMPNNGLHRKRHPTPSIRPDPSIIYAKHGDIVPHNSPPFKQQINVKITWVESQRDFYVAFLNEEIKYRVLAEDISQQNYTSLIGRKVEEGGPCMVYKDGAFYRAILESAGRNECRAFLVDFGGYMLAPSKALTPMLRQHAELPMAAIHCAIFAAFRVELSCSCINAFKRSFPVDECLKILLFEPLFNDCFITGVRMIDRNDGMLYDTHRKSAKFIRKSKHDGIYEVQIYRHDNTRHDAFLPQEAFY